MRLHALTVALLACLWGGMVAAEPAAQDVAVSTDGAYVIDPRSKLVWARCVEGMQWNGKTCVGEPLLMTHGEATALAAKKAKADQLPWRLPRVTELRRWAARDGRATGPSVQLFPAAPMDWYWTLTASIETRSVNPYNYDNIAQGVTSGAKLGVKQGWAINMATGEAEGDVSRRSRLVVRLVATRQ